MKIARRTLHISKEELVEVLGLPEGVEILEVVINSGYHDGFNFQLASAEEVYIGDLKVTTIEEPHSMIRRIGLASLRNARAKLESEKNRIN